MFVFRLALLSLTLGVLVVAFAGHSSAGEEPVPTTRTVRWGPFNVPGGDTHDGGGHGLSFQGLQGAACVDCYITSMTARLLHDDESPANLSTGGMLHHVVVGNSSAQDLTCGGVFPVGLLGERFFAAGNERTLATFPEGFGYYNGPAAYWAYVVEIMNMGHEAENFYLELEATFLPGDAAVTPLRPLWLDMNLCGNSQYSVPAGYSDLHSDWTSTIEGNIVVMGGHVHDYGISVSAENTTTGEMICTSVAGYAEGSDAAPVPVTGGRARASE